MTYRLKGTGTFGVLLLAAAVVATMSALAAPGGSVTGQPGAEKAVGDSLTRLGLFGSEILPHVPLDSTSFTVCPARGRCATDYYPASDYVSFGILPAYQGTVHVSVKGPGGVRPVFSCTMPGACPVLATGGSSTGPFQLIGDAAPDAVGHYVLWVAHG